MKTPIVPSYSKRLNELQDPSRQVWPEEPTVAMVQVTSQAMSVADPYWMYRVDLRSSHETLHCTHTLQ